MIVWADGRGGPWEGEAVQQVEYSPNFRRLQVRFLPAVDTNHCEIISQSGALCEVVRPCVYRSYFAKCLVHFGHFAIGYLEPVQGQAWLVAIICGQ